VVPNSLRRLVPAAGRLGGVLALALGITALQIGLGCALTSAHGFLGRYRGLFHADCGWYLCIVEDGYVSPPQITRENTGNVAFFPGHPAAVWLVSRATRLNARDSVLVAAQLACVGFWAYLLLFLARWGVPSRVAVPAVVLVASHPAAFFLIVGYSESLFLMAALGFFYWASSGSRLGLVVAAVHGFAMTSTRLVGAPLVIVPILQQLLEGAPGETMGRRARRLLPLATTAGFAACGAILFFAYCRWRFGRWDVYVLTERAGWGVHADYAAVFRKRTYFPRWPRVEHGWIIPQWFDHLSVPAVLGTLTAFALAEWRLARGNADTGWRWRAGLYAAAAILFYLNVSGRSVLDLAGMVRYAHAIVVLFVLAGAHLVSRVGLPGRRVTTGLAVLAAVWVAIALGTQVVFIWRFTRGLWVA
jgi:hypothetical protein